MDREKCKRCAHKKETIEYCISNIKCENIITEDECRNCKHDKTGIFDKNKNVKSDFEEDFTRILKEIAKDYGH